MDRQTVEKLDEVVKLKKSNRSEIIREGIELIYSDTKK